MRQDCNKKLEPTMDKMEVHENNTQLKLILLTENLWLLSTDHDLGLH